MSPNNEFRARAAECQRKAQFASSEAEKRTWLRLAESWLLMVNFRQGAEQKLRDAQREFATLQQELGASH
jgi:hypothetical protein